MKKSISVFMILLLSLSFLQFPIQKSEAVTPTVNLASISGCNTPVGIYYDSGKVVWYPCYDNGALKKVDYATDPATVTSYSFGAPTFEIISAWGDASNIYLVERQGGRVWKFVKSSGTASVITTGLTAEAWYQTKIGDYLYVAYNGGIAKIDVSDGSKTLISTGLAMIGVSTDGSLVFATALSGKIFEINPSTNAATERVSGLNRPLGIFCDSTDCYIAENRGVNYGTASDAIIKKISRSSWSVTNTATLAGEPYGIIKISTLIITSSAASSKKVYIRQASNLSTTGLTTTEVSVNKNLFMLQTDGTSIYVGFTGSGGIAKIDNFLPVDPVVPPPPPPDPVPPPPPPPPKDGSDSRLPISVSLLQNQTARKGTNFNLSVTLSKNAFDGYVMLYSDRNDFIAYRTLKNQSAIDILTEATWLGTKNIRALFSGDKNYKSNYSNYITLNSVEPLRSIKTATSKLSIVNKEVSVLVQSNDKYFVQNVTVITQIKDSKGVIVYFATLPVQIYPISQTSFFLGGDVPSGFVEVYVWKSLKEGIALAEVSQARN